MLFFNENEKALETARYEKKYHHDFKFDINNHAYIRSKDISYHTALISQRDTLANVLVMEAATTMCLVLASRRGCVSLVSGSALAHSVGPSYMLPVVPGGHKPAGARARGCSWLCDAIIMPDAKAVVYALSDRSLHFYDTACSLRSDAVQEHRHLWRVVGLPHSVTSLAYHEGSESEHSLLFLGDEQGSITTLTFLQPNTVLFQRRGLEAKPGQAEAVYWPEMLRGGGPHCQHVTVRVDKHVHSEAVLQILYSHDQQTVMSCSLDTKLSLVLRHRTGKMPTYSFNLDEGIRCFTFHSQHHQLASGSDDGILRLWNPLVPTRPVACLSGHESPIVDVLFTAAHDWLVSLCRFAELRVWSTRQQHCVQHVHLSALALTHNWAGARSLLMWHGDSLLVALGPRLAEVPLTTSSSPDSSCSQYDSETASQEDAGRHEAEWQDQQVTSVVNKDAANLNVDSSEVSECASTSTTSQKDDFLFDANIKVPEFQLNLDEFSKSTFKKPIFSPSALEIINFRDADTDTHAPGMNERIEIQERILSQRRQLVEQCAPHLALTLWPPTTINPPSTRATTSDPQE